jgi:hypothetical protein
MLNCRFARNVSVRKVMLCCASHATEIKPSAVPVESTAQAQRTEFCCRVHHAGLKVTLRKVNGSSNLSQANESACSHFLER